MKTNFIIVSGYAINRNEVLMVTPIHSSNAEFFFTITFKNNIDLQVKIKIDFGGNSKEKMVDGSEFSWPEIQKKFIYGQLKIMDFVRYRDLALQHAKLIDHLENELAHHSIST